MSAHDIFDLTGRVIIVTGAGGGIGSATAMALAGKGASLMLTDIEEGRSARTAETVRAAGGTARALAHDVTDRADWDRVIEAVEAEWGRLDALVNNAGIMITTPFLDTPLEELQRTLRINTEGVFIGSQAAVGLMTKTAETKGAKPSIVNLSSIYGQIAGPAHVTYSASKGAVRQMGKGMAVELAQRGIRVNSVHPGPVNTALLAGAIGSLVSHGRMASDEKGFAAVARGHPMGRTAEPEDIAGVIAFLCGDASAFMTGAELTVDGGYSLL